MPFWRRQQYLDRSLAAYRRIYDDLEISICDDGSPEPVNAPGYIVNRLPQKTESLNPCTPANIAVRSSTRSVIVLTNPEVEHRTDVLTPMLAMLESEMDYVASRCWDEPRNRLHVGPGVIRGDDLKLIPQGAYFHMCAMMHRSLFELVGGFDEAFRPGYGFEDTDFLWKLHDAGARFKLYDGMVYHTYWTPIEHKPRMTNEEMFRARWQHKWS